MNATQSYLSEPINFGGVMTPRGEAIATMRTEGHPENCIQRWLQGSSHAVARNTSTLKPSTRAMLKVRKQYNSGGERQDGLLTSRHIRAMRSEPMRNTLNGHAIFWHAREIADKASKARDSKARRYRLKRSRKEA